MTTDQDLEKLDRLNRWAGVLAGGSLAVAFAVFVLLNRISAQPTSVLLIVAGICCAVSAVANVLDSVVEFRRGQHRLRGAG